MNVGFFIIFFYYFYFLGNYNSPRDEGNVINVTFAIYALNNETHLDKEVTFTMTVTVGRDVLYSEKHKIKLVPRKDADKVILLNYFSTKLIPLFIICRRIFLSLVSSSHLLTLPGTVVYQIMVDTTVKI